VSVLSTQELQGLLRVQFAIHSWFDYFNRRIQAKAQTNKQTSDFVLTFIMFLQQTWGFLVAMVAMVAISSSCNLNNGSSILVHMAVSDCIGEKAKGYGNSW
jgi:hypothetical protein